MFSIFYWTQYTIWTSTLEIGRRGFAPPPHSTLSRVQGNAPVDLNEIDPGNAPILNGKGHNTFQCFLGKGSLQKEKEPSTLYGSDLKSLWVIRKIFERRKQLIVALPKKGKGHIDWKTSKTKCVDKGEIGKDKKYKRVAESGFQHPSTQFTS